MLHNANAMGRNLIPGCGSSASALCTVFACPGLLHALKRLARGSLLLHTAAQHRLLLEAGSHLLVFSLPALTPRRTTRNLHVALSMDPSNELFRPRCEANPALLTRAALQWLPAWSPKGLAHISHVRLQVGRVWRAAQYRE